MLKTFIQGQPRCIIPVVSRNKTYQPQKESLTIEEKKRIQIYSSSYCFRDKRPKMPSKLESAFSIILVLSIFPVLPRGPRTVQSHTNQLLMITFRSSKFPIGNCCCLWNAFKTSQLCFTCQKYYKPQKKNDRSNCSFSHTHLFLQLCSFGFRFLYLCFIHHLI